MVVGAVKIEPGVGWDKIGRDRIRTGRNKSPSTLCHIHISVVISMRYAATLKTGLK